MDTFFGILEGVQNLHPDVKLFPSANLHRVQIVHMNKALEGFEWTGNLPACSATRGD